MQHELSSAVAAHIIEVQLARVHRHNTCADEQYELKEGVIDHVLDCAVGSESVFALQQAA